MKTKIFHKNYRVCRIAMVLFAVSLTGFVQASPLIEKSAQQDTLSFVRYKGSVRDSETRKPLVFATISLNGTNIVTISNSEGEFLLKVPKNLVDAKVTVSYIGYKSSEFNLSDFRPENNQIELVMQNINLNPVTVFPKDPELLMRAVMNKIGKNYTKDPLLMTAFYREAIKKRRTYVSLSEAVVEIVKQPYLSSRGDYAQIYKGRKSTDYGKLDTLAFKLQGGPYTNLKLDIMKNPEMIFTDDMIGNYQFTLNDITKMNDRLTYIIRFRQWPHLKGPLYYGELYVDTETLALAGAVFDLNVEDRDAASQMFLKKKPVGARVYPTSAEYRVDYREKDGRWYLGYSRGQITFKVIWNRKLFNTIYESTIEMLVTDWKKLAENPVNPAERLKPTVIMADQISGFADPEFWGEYNVIEPEKPIESAIKKIQKNLERKDR